MQNIDTHLFFLINRGMANPFFDILMPLLTSRGFLLVIPFLPYVLYRGAAAKASGNRTFLAPAIAAVVIPFIAFPLAALLCAALKNLVARPRPCDVLDAVRLLVACPRSFSFPSSHATTSFAFAAPLFLLTRRFLRTGWRLYPVVLAALIALSRPYVGVHYPFDIAAGTLLGTGVAVIFCELFLGTIGRGSREEARTEGRRETSQDDGDGTAPDR